MGALVFAVMLLGATAPVPKALACPAGSGVTQDRDGPSRGETDADADADADAEREAVQARMVARTEDLVRQGAFPFLFAWVAGLGVFAVMAHRRWARCTREWSTPQPTAALFLLALFGYLAAQAAMTFLLIALRAIAPGVSLPLASVLGQVAAVGACVWLVRSALRWPFGGLELHGQGLGRGLVLALVVYLVQLPVFVACLEGSYRLLGRPQFQIQVLEIARHTDVMYRGLFFVAVVVMAPVLEEVIFRGLILSGFRRRLGPGAAIVVSALLFALVHPPSTYFPIFWLGLLFGWIYVYTRNLLVPMALHALHNALQYALILWAVSGPG